MTIIVGFIDKEGIGHLCSDSMGSNFLSSGAKNREYQKIFCTEDENLLYAITGSPKLMELQYYKFLGSHVYEPFEAEVLVNKEENSDSDEQEFETLNLFKKKLNTPSHKYFMTKLKYKIKDKIDHMSYQKDKDVNPFETDIGSIILLHEDKMYQYYSSDGSMIPVPQGQLVVDGSGIFHGEGAYNILENESLTPKERLIKTVQSAIDSANGVGKGIWYANTQDYKVEKIR